MPRRGYRKGISDRKTPRPQVIKSRASAATHAALHQEAGSRSMTFSALVADVLDAHVTGTRLEVPHARGQDAAMLRELARLGNNVNQIAREAHLLNLHLITDRARRTLDALHAAVDRVGR